MSTGERRHEDRPTLREELPLEHLTEAAQDLLEAWVSRAVGSAIGRITDLTASVTNPEGSGASAGLSGVKDLLPNPRKVLDIGVGGMKNGVKNGVKNRVEGAVRHAVGGGGGQRKGGGKVVNIVEECDVGLPLSVTYDQWTAFEDYPGFTRKVEKVEQESDEKLSWRAKIFFSHREWESTIVEQVPDERIVWRSSGAKGYVDGAVTFHELAPTLTRILLVLEYYPQGFVEKTANLWRAQGRRVRADFKHIKRHMMTRTILDPDAVEGWRGEIRDGEVVRADGEEPDDGNGDAGRDSDD
ncbi:SRPBCC family protein [Prauserella rugosa]|uniref:Polyketide cyclase/dehydrase/lipid transport protein n=1 Tax=Prauserella rugosa TaxID=43354 RepID=A0A660C9B3_9PSEU|nr:SRPBCC family protein [Prauserella rugosa]TWH20042.1 polyketide cyclase/dehydrase/lipid transport protein [Prauserella rugosa]